MSEENVELVRRTYEAVNKGDSDAMVLYFHPEIEFHAYPRSPGASTTASRPFGSTSRTCGSTSKEFGSR